MEIKGKIYPFCTPWHVLAAWPQDEELLFLGGRGSQRCYLALRWQQISAAEFLDLKLAAPAPDHPSLFITALSYEDARRGEWSSKCQSLFFEVSAWAEFDMENQALRVFGATSFDFPTCDELRPSPPIRLDPDNTDELAAAQVSRVIESIRDGRYYQLNLLRYFRVNGRPTPSEIADRHARLSGPYGAWIRSQNTELISFSPERFVNGAWDDTRQCWIMRAYPIKGTTSQDFPPEQLADSLKDQAELHMIVDLMRNDLQKLSVVGGVEVLASHKLHQFATIAHLQAEISAQLRSNLTLGDVVTALCPGGSITGAPKVEVMKAISEFEATPRNFFMGHVFCYDPRRATLDSNVLIRTMQELPGEDGFWYAAGSGITVLSDPQKELAEIAAKCRVLTDS